MEMRINKKKIRSYRYQCYESQVVKAKVLVAGAARSTGATRICNCVRYSVAKPKDKPKMKTGE
jgi:hypothetical protein